jgi:hypothetical protein
MLELVDDHLADWVFELWDKAHTPAKAAEVSEVAVAHPLNAGAA